MDGSHNSTDLSKNNTEGQGSSLGDMIGVPIASIITIVTILGNILVLISILSQYKLRNCRSNRFLVNLAVADLCVGLFVMIPAVVKSHEGEWPWGADLCMLWVTVDVGFCSASIYSLIGISIDRFYAVYWPLRYVSHRKNTLTTNLLLCLSWLMAVVISSPMYVNTDGFSNWSTSVRENSAKACIPPVEPSSTGYVIYASVLAFILPAVLLSVFYTLITFRMRQRQLDRIKKAKGEVEEDSGVQSSAQQTESKMRRQDTIDNTQETSDVLFEVLHEKMRKSSTTKHNMFSGDSIRFSAGKSKSKRMTRAERKYKKEIQVQRRITIMMGVIVSTFALCWAPFCVMFTSFPFSFEFWAVRNADYIDTITWIGYVNSSLNPVIYAIMNHEIRRGMINIFVCRRK